MLTIGGGSAEAPLVGGCLTLLASSIGTPYEFEADGCVLMVEDLNTEPYLVDTALNHLLQAGKLDNIAGFVFGTDVNLKNQTIPDEPESTLSIEQMLDELIAPLGIPAIANVPFGHGKHMATMPLGARVRIDGDAKTLEVTEAAVAAPDGRRRSASRTVGRPWPRRPCWWLRWRSDSRPRAAPPRTPRPATRTCCGSAGRRTRRT